MDSDRASVASGDEPTRVPHSGALQLATALNVRACSLHQDTLLYTQDNSVAGSSSFMDGFSIDDDLELSPTSVHRQRRESSSSVVSGIDE